MGLAGKKKLGQALSNFQCFVDEHEHVPTGARENLYGKDPTATLGRASSRGVNTHTRSWRVRAETGRRTNVHPQKVGDYATLRVPDRRRTDGHSARTAFLLSESLCCNL